MRRACFFDCSPPVPLFAPPSPNNLENFLAMSKDLAHPLHPVYDDGKGGGWKWWEWHFVLVNFHTSAYARCLAGMLFFLGRAQFSSDRKPPGGAVMKRKKNSEYPIRPTMAVGG